MSFTYRNLDDQTITETGGDMPATDMLSIPSITGGAAAPSSAMSQGSSSWVSMNNPFSVSGAGGRANSTAESSTGFDLTSVILMAIIGAIITKVMN